MDLGEAVQRYLQVAGAFGRPVPLAGFGLTREETEGVFSVWDEDYQISRYMELSLRSGASSPQAPGSQDVYQVNAFHCSHVSFHPDIEQLLGPE